MGWGRAQILSWLQRELFSLPTRLFWNSGILWKSTEIFPKILFLMLFLMNIISSFPVCFVLGFLTLTGNHQRGGKPSQNPRIVPSTFSPNKLIYLLKSIFPINPTFPLPGFFFSLKGKAQHLNSLILDSREIRI